MAGGIFPGAPFTFNIKCVIFSAMLAGGYWFLPPKNLFVLFFLLWFPYLAMAWYDYMYECRNKLGPTIVPFGRFMWLPFKPPQYQAEFNKMSERQIGLMGRVDHLVGWTLLILAIAFVLRSSQ